ncbi:flagellar basal body rod protein FlgC [Geoalkalibacter subterraneus]|uniref:Flagellar basal-body rod protein FlgC n=1 Tax=Geoalkalibacter subterraneus TaxID=483547 RepID=A0A0B5FTT9_9BACT|nr:flagellar basal body rod protein FlgC [Geoalkalibacter subterraneus]AJF07600.1 flagellar basal body rod protein FlgC [Geoalkalibacter subterraneus]
MDIFTSMKVGASALKAQRMRLNTISSNLANVETTSTPEGGPYKKKNVVFRPVGTAFEKQLDSNLKGAVQGVQVQRISADERAPRMVYDPAHPDADPQGYVAMPNINVMDEIVDMMSATSAYEANVTVVQSAKRMALKALEIGK